MDIKKGKDTFISKLLTIENYWKSDVRVVYEFLKVECKAKDLKFAFRSFFLHLPSISPT